MKKTVDDFKKRILAEMTVDYANALEKNFEMAKQFLRITKEGKVDVQRRNGLTGQQRILLYLIGKLYAKEASLVDTYEVGNKELRDELGIPNGSLLPWLKSLRKKKNIRQTKNGRYTNHSVSLNAVEKILKGVEKNLKKSRGKD